MTTHREVMQQALDKLDSMNHEDSIFAGEFDQEIAALRAALSEQCPCGEKPKTECPGEWEPGCDLGNNAAHARKVQRTETEQKPVACVSSEVLEFLRGVAPLDGVWFGESHPTERGHFWWRKHLAAPQRTEPEQEPVGEVGQIDIDCDGQESAWVSLHNPVKLGQPLYTHPPKRKPLTEWQIIQMKAAIKGTLDVQFIDFARAIERAHGIGGEA